MLATGANATSTRVLAFPDPRGHDGRGLPRMQYLHPTAREPQNASMSYAVTRYDFRDKARATTAAPGAMEARGSLLAGEPRPDRQRSQHRGA